MGTFLVGVRREAEQGNYCGLHTGSQHWALVPGGDGAGPEQQEIETMEREGKREDSEPCPIDGKYQAEIPGRSKHQEKGGFIYHKGE